MCGRSRPAAGISVVPGLASSLHRDVDTGSLLPLAFNTLPTALVVGTGLARQRQEYIVLGCMSLLVMAIGIWRVFKLPRRRIERARELNSVPPGALATTENDPPSL